MNAVNCIHQPLLDLKLTAATPFQQDCQAWHSKPKLASQQDCQEAEALADGHVHVLIRHDSADKRAWLEQGASDFFYF